jgi:ketosteroid isomerase-like protein
MGTLKDMYTRGWQHLAEGRLDALLDLYAPDVEVKEVGQLFHGREAVRQQYQLWLDAFSDMRVAVLHVIEGDDEIAGEVRITCTHSGPLPTPNGPLPPTGRTVVIESCDIARVRDGRVVSFHSYFDQLGLLAQLGLLPAPSQAATAV